MFRKFSVAALCVVLVFLFAQKVSAGESRLTVHYGVGDGAARLELGLVGDFTAEQRAIIVYTNLFEDCCGVGSDDMPKGAKLLSAKLADGRLTLDVSVEILAMEADRLSAVIARNAEGLPEVEAVTLLINGKAYLKI